MPDPVRQQILEAVRTRLLAITRINGYATDAGRAVFLGEIPVLGPDDPEVAIAIAIDDDEVEWNGENVGIVMPIGIAMLAKADTLYEDAWIAVESGLGDIKRALELSDRTFGGVFRHPQQFQRGSTATLERESGSTTVGARITYRAAYIEQWGAP